MADVAAAAERLIRAYNAKDFETLEALIAPDLDFAHYNRDFAMNSREALLEVLRGFASTYAPDRHFEAPERVTVAGDIVVREAWYAGTAAIDLPGFGAAGEAFRFKFCSVMRFDDAGLLVEWKDHG
ncbi:nuclear transport factor 2 family protein [Sphingobium sp.]|uniref:nuclear transport factor 2 family protein n=1 Tax=Sphingobium sp. TaxID=1912891 RepID=UPI0028BE5332|nr:nuclear transport factor 2 family protein [Sphingobium sp.]